MRARLRGAGAVLLVSCYELGHAPLGLASPLGFLAREGFDAGALDIAVDPLDPEAIRAAAFIGVSVPMHTALRLGLTLLTRIRALNPGAHVCFYGLYASLNAERIFAQGGDSVIGGEYELPLLGLIEAEDRTIAELPLLSPEEKQRVLVAWNATDVAYPEGTLLHQLVEAQVDRSPEAIALSFAGKEVSFRALDERANRLARSLRGLGVGPGAVVAVYMERSFDLVAGLLAVLKAAAPAVVAATPVPTPQPETRPVQRPRMVVGIVGEPVGGVPPGFYGTDAAHLQHAAGMQGVVCGPGGRFKGIRHAGGWDASPLIHNSHTRPPPGLYGDATFRQGFAQLAPLGLSFEAWQFHPQLPEVTALARAFPDTSIILNHLGGPLGVGPYAGQVDTTFAQWRTHMAELAQCPNVTVKLGGLGMKIGPFDHHARPVPPSSQQVADAWRPWVETAITQFGAQRCMFESNFPVDKGGASYAVLWNAFKRIAAGASADEKAALFADTARRVYKL